MNNSIDIDTASLHNEMLQISLRKERERQEQHRSLARKPTASAIIETSTTMKSKTNAGHRPPRLDRINSTDDTDEDKKIVNGVTSTGAEQQQQQPHSSSSSSSLFLVQHPENSNLNQYWYSTSTIQTLCRAIRNVIVERHENGGSRAATRTKKMEKRVAFLSTPSLYFSFTETERRNFVLFDYDDTLLSSREDKDNVTFIHYDYNKPRDFASKEQIKGTFDVVVIDPPFITREVWERYGATASFLLEQCPRRRRRRRKTNNNGGGGLVLATTVGENEGLMWDLFRATKARFRPSIPNLVYQYETFVNFESDALSNSNPETS